MTIASLGLQLNKRAQPNRRARNLAALRPGQSAVVGDLVCEGMLRRRLLDLGLVPGTRVRAVMVGMGGDPVAYLVRGTLIALRRSDARCIVLH